MLAPQELNKNATGLMNIFIIIAYTISNVYKEKDVSLFSFTEDKKHQLFSLLPKY